MDEKFQASHASRSKKREERKEGTEERVACTSKVAGCGRIATYWGLGRAHGGGPWFKQEILKSKTPGFREAFVLISSKPPSAKKQVAGFRVSVFGDCGRTTRPLASGFWRSLLFNAYP